MGRGIGSRRQLARRRDAPYRRTRYCKGRPSGRLHRSFAAGADDGKTRLTASLIAL